jgi:hypothetical protein
MYGKRWTIGRIMAWIAIAACALSVPHARSNAEVTVIASIQATAAVFILTNTLLDLLLGLKCPACSRFALKRIARARSYYRCTACCRRFKRANFGPWLDASGPEDAARFETRTVAHAWRGFAVPSDLDGTTSGALLQGKRERHLDRAGTHAEGENCASG